MGGKKDKEWRKVISFQKEEETLDEICAWKRREKEKKEISGEKNAAALFSSILSIPSYMRRVCIRNFVWPCEGPT